MVKIYMTSGTIFYRNDTNLEEGASQIQAFRTYVNSANARGSAVITAYKDDALTQPVQIQLTNVEYWEDYTPAP